MAGILVAFAVGPVLKLSGLTKFIIVGAGTARLTMAILAARPRVSKTLVMSDHKRCPAVFAAKVAINVQAFEFAVAKNR